MKKLFIVVAFVVTLIPAILVVQKAGGMQHWQGVPPSLITDSLYYSARIHEVLDGHPLIGNPYAYEHRDAISPASFLPDIVSSVPMFLGVPFNIALLVNVFIWSLLFLLLAFTLFRLLQLPVWWAFSWTILSYLCSYSFMLRPTVMQMVYPAFLLFLIALLKFLYEPFVRRRVVWLALASAATFYLYTYLAYLVLLSFVFVFIWFLCTRRFKELRALVIAGGWTVLFIIPFGIYTLMQMHDPNYLEIFSRIGLVYTHIPSIESFFYGRWVVLGLAALALLWRFFPKNKEGDSERKIFWLATGASLLVALFLNVITGVELTLGVHIGRFVILWMVLILAVGLHEGYVLMVPKINRIAYMLAALLLIILAGGTAVNIPRGLGFLSFNARGETVADIQPYAGPLNWLQAHVPEQSVIWANESLSRYIPIMTRHYPLFFEGAALHSISDRELEDRYLLAHSREALTTEDLKRDFGLYAGAGAPQSQPLAQNQRAWLCRAVARFTGTQNCPSYTDGIALRGEAYFKTLMQRFITIQKDQTALLQHYHVKYFIIDRVHDHPITIPQGTSVYDDGRFEILSLRL